ncbi:uncharacterized protein LOC127566464 isoform X3 [Pristis pectinata]|uniref:uncharacterized protein LOC127566464 isoform X3 n=1 Tax=Pristis pectinata TaxID=685728 RepID=UPI00223C8C24|nr:uncharacterized protein LOC127566464 isoform X3 [Pristis pectinata]
MNTAALFLLFVTVTVQTSETQALVELRISHDRPDKVYVKGESITFTCEGDIPRSSSGFSLYRGTTKLQVTPQENSSSTKSVKFLLTVMLIRTVCYLCFYGADMAQSEDVCITVVDRPEKPELSADRNDKTYVTDEAARFTCRTWYLYSDCSVDLYRFGQHVPTESKKCTSSSYDATFTITFNSAGSEDYYCVHARTVSGRVVSSAPSKTVRITVVDPPGKPKLLADRKDKIYPRDEKVALTCETFHSSSVSSVELSTVGQHVQIKRREDISSPYSVVFTISDTSPGSEDYFCTYTLNRSGRELTSQPSESVKITIVDLPRPSITVYSNEVRQGEHVTFNCTSPRQRADTTFYLYRQWGSNYSVVQSATAQTNSVTFTIRATYGYNSGNYTCGYEATEGGRQLKSAQSDSVHLSVTANSGLSWIIPLAVLTLVIMSSLLVVYLWKKGKIRSRGEMRVDPPPEVQTHDNVVYADLKMKPLPKKRKGRQETSQMNDPNDTVYSAVKT